LAPKGHPAWTHVFRVVFQTPGGRRPRRSALTGRPEPSVWPVPPAGRTVLRRLARVTMMEASDHGGLDNPAVVKVLHRSWLRGVLLQGEVCPGPVVVDEVPAQQATQMGFVQHHDVVETLAAEGADEPFHVRILTRRPSGRLDFVDPMSRTRFENSTP
jgi:hypothetical protein